MDIPWQKDLATKWLDAAKQNRLPHAVLLAGPPGVGKRALAAWMVGRKLGCLDAPVPGYPFEPPQHPDLHWLSRPEDKTSILIDQVRALVHDLSLTSHSGRGKAAVIEPAHLMTNSAANSLLKTLEEPPGDALLVLIADRTGRLPATIFSRCQRIEVRVPAEADAIEWLDRLHPGKSWAEPLRMAGHAPIAAIDALEMLEASTAMGREFQAVALGQLSPVEIAAKWSKSDVSFVLDWLARQVQQVARSLTGGEASGTAASNSVLQRMDRRNVFCYLDQINRLRGQPQGSFNVTVALEGLLIDWATGLRNVDRNGTPAALSLAGHRLVAGPQADTG